MAGRAPMMVTGKATKAQAGVRAANPLARSLEALRRLCDQRDSVDALLEDATQIALDLLAAELCAIVWRDETRPTLRVRARRWRDGRSAGGEDDARIIAFVAGLPEAGASKGPEQARALRVGGQTIGYLYLREAAKPGRGAGGVDAALFDALAEHLGFAIETQNLRQLLASRYAAIALSRDVQRDSAAPSTLDGNVLAAVTHPEKVARIIARSFYKDLRRAGFETKQILVVATELIDSLNVALRRTKAKTAQTETETETETDRIAER
jgi:hypothetical protein